MPERIRNLLTEDAIFTDAEFTYIVYLYPNDTSRNRAKFRRALWNFLSKHPTMEKVGFKDANKIAHKIRKEKK